MILALAGGVGGAKLAAGLQSALDRPQDLLTVVNTGDDFEHLGLAICPDLDTVMYTLSGRANPETGGASRERRGTSSTPSRPSAARTGSGSATATSPPTSSAPAACGPGRP